MEMPLNHLSYSQVSMYLRCPMKYYWRYIRGYKIPPSAAMSLGSSVDYSLNYNYSEKLKTGTDEPLDTLLDVFHEDFTARKEETDFSNEAPEKVEKDGLELVKVYRREVAPAVEPVAVQPKMTVEFDNRPWTFVAYPDLIRIEGNGEAGVIVDHKTKKRNPSPDVAAISPQLTAYAAAYSAYTGGVLPDAVEIDCLIRPQKNTGAQFKRFTAERGEKEIERWWYIVDSVAKSISAGIFHPCSPTLFDRRNPECSPDWCGYWELCHNEQSAEWEGF